MNGILQLVERCARETAEELGIALSPEFNANSPLFGREGLFDSMGLVSVIVLVEEAIADEFGVDVVLADQRAMSQQKSPFLSCSALAAYAARLIDDSRR